MKTCDCEVRNVNEAVALAREWQRAGTHSWFRGQNKEAWQLVSRLTRAQLLGPQEADAVHARMGLLCKWVTSVPELRYLLEPEHVHAFFAVLQHYGVPTHYIDFTSNPAIAGFFAACGPDARPGEKGCIIAIDPDKIIGILRTLAEAQQKPQEARPEKVVVSVDNLWRLQAQSGNFLYLPMVDVESICAYDRIIFTHEDKPYDIAEEAIYPKRKSTLEIRLDQFFTRELMLNNQIYFQDLVASWRAAGRSVSETRAERVEPADYAVPGAVPHPSWSEVPESWSNPPREHLAEAITSERVVLEFDPAASPLAVLKQVEGQVMQVTFDPGSRGKALNWVVRTVGQSIAEKWKDQTNASLARVWDGMRQLPYTNAQLAAALGATVSLSACSNQFAGGGRAGEEFSPLLGDVLVLDVTAEDGQVYSQAAVGTNTLAAAFRDDLWSMVADPWRTQCAGQPRKLLQILNRPEYLFPFPRLVDLFAHQIIPTQVLMQRTDLGIFFSPVQISALGPH